MSAVDDVDRLIDRYKQALDVFMKGNPEPVKELFSICKGGGVLLGFLRADGPRLWRDRTLDGV